MKKEVKLRIFGDLWEVGKGVKMFYVIVVWIECKFYLLRKGFWNRRYFDGVILWVKFGMYKVWVELFNCL